MNPMLFQPSNPQISGQIYKLFIFNLDPAVTEEILWKEMKQRNIQHIKQFRICKDTNGSSRCFGFISFNQPDQCSHAKAQLKHAQVLSKKLVVVEEKSKNEQQKIYSNQSFFLKNPSNIDENSIESFLTQFGTIFSLSLIYKKNGQPAGYGFVNFEKEEGFNKLSQIMEPKMSHKFQIGSAEIELLPYKPFEQRPHSTCMMIRDFATEFLGNLENKEEKDNFIKEKTEEIQQKFKIKEIGQEPQSIFVTLLKNKVPYALICYQDEIYAKKLAENVKQYNQETSSAVVCEEKKQTKSKNCQGGYDKILLKNLRKDCNDQELVEFLKQFGAISGQVLIKEPNIQENSTFKQDLASKCALLFYKDEKSGEQFFQNYIKNPQYKQFINPKLQPSATILLPRSTREHLKKMKSEANLVKTSQQPIPTQFSMYPNMMPQQQFNQMQFQQGPQVPPGQFQQRTPQPYNQQYQRQPQNRYQRPPPNQQYPQNRRGPPQNQGMPPQQFQNQSMGPMGQPGVQPMGLPQNMGQPIMSGQPQQIGLPMGQPAMNQQINPVMPQMGIQGQLNMVPQQQPINPQIIGIQKPQQPPPQVIQQQVPQIPKQPPQQQQQQPAPQQNINIVQKTLTLEWLKSNVEKFMSYDDNTKRSHLGNFLYPKVEQIVSEKSEAPKVTGMLIDFEVFEVTDILEFIENPEELRERVKEAEELIRSQSQEPST